MRQPLRPLGHCNSLKRTTAKRLRQTNTFTGRERGAAGLVGRFDEVSINYMLQSGNSGHIRHSGNPPNRLNEKKMFFKAAPLEATNLQASVWSRRSVGDDDRPMRCSCFVSDLCCSRMKPPSSKRNSPVSMHNGPCCLRQSRLLFERAERSVIRLTPGVDLLRRGRLRPSAQGPTPILAPAGSTRKRAASTFP